MLSSVAKMSHDKTLILQASVIQVSIIIKHLILSNSL